MERTKFLLLLVLLSIPSLAACDQWADVEQKCKSAWAAKAWFTIGDCVLGIFQAEPIHPLVPSSLVPGSGIAVGLWAHQNLDTKSWQNSLEGTAAVTPAGFWRLNTTLKMMHVGPPDLDQPRSNRPHFAI